jgi:hypothetical protein
VTTLEDATAPSQVRGVGSSSILQWNTQGSQDGILAVTDLLGFMNVTDSLISNQREFEIPPPLSQESLRSIMKNTTATRQ